MDTILIKSQSKLQLRCGLPGDKSVSHRAVIFAALANGVSVVRNLLESEDCMNTLKIFQAMGVRAKRGAGGVWRIEGRGLDGLRAPAKANFDCGNSGTTMRLLAGVLSAQGFRCSLTGDESLRSRPMGRVVNPLNEMGAGIRTTDNRAPLHVNVEKSELRNFRYVLPVASAQVKSSLLLAGLCSRKKIEVVEPVATRDHTERFMKFTGIPLIKRGKSLILKPVKKDPKVFRLTVPGDISSAAFLLAVGILVPGSRITLQGVLDNPGRDGLVRALKRMGAGVKVLNRRVSGPERISDLEAKFTAKLKPVHITPDEVPGLIDELPILMVLATQAHGESVLEGIGELRVKETDRVKSMVDQLRKMGAKIKVAGDTIRVQGPAKLTGAEIQSFGDHRTAMSFVVAGMIASGQTRVHNTACINTSFKDFLPLLKRSGVRF